MNFQADDCHADARNPVAAGCTLSESVDRRLQTGVVIVLIVLFMVVAVVFAVGSGLASRADRQWFARNGRQVQGQIVSVRVRLQTSTTTDGLGMMTTSSYRRFVPTVRFTTVDGTVVETETRPSSRRPGAAGEAVNVCYDPADPSRARISSS